MHKIDNCMQKQTNIIIDDMIIDITYLFAFSVKFEPIFSYMISSDSSGLHTRRGQPNSFVFLLLKQQHYRTKIHFNIDIIALIIALSSNGTPIKPCNFLCFFEFSKVIKAHPSKYVLFSYNVCEAFFWSCRS